MKKILKFLIVVCLIALLDYGIITYFVKKESEKNAIESNRLIRNDVGNSMSNENTQNMDSNENISNLIDNNVAEENDGLLYQYRYSFYTSRQVKGEFLIYMDGTYSYIDTYEEGTQKRGKIKSNYLKKLKKLADQVEVDVQEDDGMITMSPDRGDCDKLIYNSNTKKWVVLESLHSGRNDEYNRTEVAEKIEDLISEIQDKYKID